jgi:UDP-glucose:(heptosyl)LPS alpha-1,3-glucosyltransferase
MRIALVVEHFDSTSGGAGKWTVEFAKHLLEQGHALTVVCFWKSDDRLPAQVIALPAPRFPLARAQRIAECLADISPDVIYDAGVGYSGNVFHPHAGSLLSSRDALIAQYPKLRQLRARISPRGWLFRRSLARLEHQQATRADRIIAVSRRIGDLLASRYHLPAERINVVPNGVDIDRFDPRRLAEMREPMRRALNAGDQVLFVAIAHNMLLKGVDTAIQAIATLQREGVAARLLVAGSDPDPILIDLARKCGVINCLEFLRYVTDIVPIYAAADAVIHPTRWDACSLATLEGLASGLPVITTSMNGAAELMSHGRDGLIFSDPEDSMALASQMRVVLDPSERRRLGTRARETAVRWSARDNFRAVEKILLSVARQSAQ